MAIEIDIRNIDPEKLYTLEQVGAFLQLSYSTVLKLKKKNGFGCFKIGKRLYVKGNDILNLVEKVLVKE